MLKLSFVLLLLLVSSSTYAQDICFDYQFTKKSSSNICGDPTFLHISNSIPQGFLPLPTNQVNDDTLLWVSRALISEAGFDSYREYGILLWVMARKWQKRYNNDPTYSFKSFVLNYCTGFRFKTRNKPKQRWVQYLPADDFKPRYWPARVSWETYRNLWLDVRVFVIAWSQGSIPDPCPAATDWAAPFIKVSSKKFTRVYCGNTHNLYYRSMK